MSAGKSNESNAVVARLELGRLETLTPPIIAQKSGISRFGTLGLRAKRFRWSTRTRGASLRLVSSQTGQRQLSGAANFAVDLSLFWRLRFPVSMARVYCSWVDVFAVLRFPAIKRFDTSHKIRAESQPGWLRQHCSAHTWPGD